MFDILSTRMHLRTRAVALVAAVVLFLFLPRSWTSTSLAQDGRAHARSFGIQGNISNVLNETLGFQKIYVINLAARTDKRDAMSLAARLTGLKFEYVDAAREVTEKALPPIDNPDLTPVKLATWRSHLNVLRLIVEQGVSSALVLEDDVDWDIRIKEQMQVFAQASRTLLQPLRGAGDEDFIDPTYHSHRADDVHTNIDLSQMSKTSAPTTSPYGDLSRWDLLWLGHCGTHFPGPKNNMPLGRVVIPDQTVPEKQHISFHFGSDELMKQYPNHTRVVSRSRESMCSLAYAVSLPGAIRMLYEVGLKKLSWPQDMVFSDLCDGTGGHDLHTCLSVQPQYFEHHRAAGSKKSWSDIDPKNDEPNEMAFTRNIRWSTRLNFRQLMNGASNYVDLFKDGMPTPDLGPFV